MPAFGKHRRPRLGHVSRGFALVGTGGVALTLPLIAPAVAGAAPLSGAPQAAVQAPASPAATITVKASAAPAAARTYTVVSGDSLSLIAHKKGIQGGWKSLYQANKSVVGDNPSLIRPGLELTIRRDVVKAAPAEAKKSATTERASRSERRATPAVATGTGSSAAAAAPAVAAPSAVKAAPIAATNYADNLDGWIRESLAIMGQRGIPGSYDGIYRNVMRESSGNPQAINLWDSNAVAGTPSKGLLQVIQPTFLAYHVPGTSMDLFDPVANITAACNYAADRYGSIDNVNSAY
ncbi:LysM peptidoglycan-binding domain-containing protein [Streptomyces sp. SP18ES09]|uniref:transglycosylase SLT domain-containing protein n=1 Tax=Streptomyces sp. SP18ES09 TaxID=3002532 RepID=UPI002E77D190|nr:LysM peptidoglycan-binding domain-containing protein [Streptomyces sp. SP18ES09]MEE1820431.1 LysM peptidoglycan-binding domain-containing protein [Streptomyces sp. SP18ES09]